MLLIDKMMRDGSYDFYSKGTEISDKNKAECFHKETMRVFTDYINISDKNKPNHKKLYMLVKTWQRVTFQTEDQRFITGKVLE